MHCSSEQLRVAGELGRLAGAARDDLTAASLFELLRSACGFVAANLVRWDAHRGCHVGASNHGYDGDLDRYMVEQFPTTVPSKRIVAGRLPLRIDDDPYDFRDSETFLEQLQPRGFDDGLTAALFTEDEVYVGMLHMSAERRRHFDDDIRDFVHAVSFLVAGIVAASSPETPRPTLRWRNGDEPPMKIVRAAERFAAGPSASLRALWHHEGMWQQVEFTRPTVSGEHVDVSARPEPLPYGLTRRELQIATTLAMGMANKAIATNLQISPRTVGKHVERVLAKLECSSRSQAAVICLQEGVIDLDLVVDGRATSRLLGPGCSGRPYAE